MAQAPRIPEGSDRALRRLFGHPEVVADLLRGFVPLAPVSSFDRNSLQPLPDNRVDFNFNKRESDRTWSFSIEGGARVVMIFEAQSYEDRAMAGRMAVQVAMFCENFQRLWPSELLPEVLPVVFYTGGARWRAVRSLSEAASGKAGLLTYFADSCYLLLETGVLATGPLPKHNLVSLIVRMEAARGASDLVEVLASEREFLERRHPSLWSDYFTWAVEVLAPVKRPDTEGRGVESLQEGIDMIAERIQEEREEWRQQAMAEGLSEGKVKGLLEGRAEGRMEGLAQGRAEERARSLAREKGLLRRLILRKFGDEIAEIWSERVSTLDDDDRLRELSGMIIDCETAEELLRKL